MIAVRLDRPGGGVIGPEGVSGGMDGPSDEDLMLRVAAGEQAAFHELASRYAPRAAGLARRLTGSESEAEDVVQEALLRVWINAPRWRPLAAFRTWFYRIVVNLCLNRQRSAPLVGLDEVADVRDPSPDPGEQMEHDQAVQRLALAIAELPERQRVALTLTYSEGLSNAETAAVIGTSVSGVETLLVRARRTLRERLGGAGVEE
jgi:RNA polymerase sigma-70 factor, ECF subfamily